MSETIEVVYVDGALRPLKKLNLKEGQRVMIRIIEKDPIQVAQEIRPRLRGRLKGRDLVEELTRERERIA